MRRSPIRRRYRDTGPSRATVVLVKARAGMQCERCMVAVAGPRGISWEIHHRRPRRMGGSKDPATNGPANLLLLDLDCHRWIEANRSTAHDLGLLLHARQDPAATPVLLGGRVLCLLGPEGGYLDAPEVAS